MVYQAIMVLIKKYQYIVFINNKIFRIYCRIPDTILFQEGKPMMWVYSNDECTDNTHNS